MKQGRVEAPLGSFPCIKLWGTCFAICKLAPCWARWVTEPLFTPGINVRLGWSGRKWTAVSTFHTWLYASRVTKSHFATLYANTHHLCSQRPNVVLFLTGRRQNALPVPNLPEMTIWRNQNCSDWVARCCSFNMTLLTCKRVCTSTFAENVSWVGSPWPRTYSRTRCKKMWP